MSVEYPNRLRQLDVPKLGVPIFRRSDDATPVGTEVGTRDRTCMTGKNSKLAQLLKGTRQRQIRFGCMRSCDTIIARQKGLQRQQYRTACITRPRPYCCEAGEEP